MDIVNLKAPSLLVAMPYLKDPIFSGSVILILEHNNFGAVGFIINKPSKLHLSTIFVSADISLDVFKNNPIWTGGPVGIDKGIILHCINDSNLYDEMIADKIYIASSAKTFLALTEYLKTINFETYQSYNDTDIIKKDIQNTSNTPEAPNTPNHSSNENNVVLSNNNLNYLYPIRFILGYCGWAPMQLESELKGGSWLQMPLDLDILYNTPWQNMWNRCLSSLSIEPSFIAPVEQLYLN